MIRAKLILLVFPLLITGCSSEPGHNYSSSWSYDTTSHWHACTDQGFEELKSDIANHTFNTVVTEPTYTSGGYTTHTCSICNYSYRDNETNPLVRTYTITWKDYDGTTLEVDRDLTQNSPLSYDGNTPTREDYHFRGWSYNGTKVFDEKGNKLVNITISSDMTFIALYSQTAIMTITKNIPEAGSVIGEGEYPYNTYVDVSATPNQGYKFIGWYYENTLLSNNTDYKYIMWDQDVNLEARFVLDSFKLNIHTNNETYGLVLLRSNTNNEYKSKYEEMRDYTSTVQIAAYSNTDVRFLGWYNEDNELVYSNAVQSFTMPNHNLSLEAKWNYFNITYNLNGGTNNDNNPSSYTVDDGVITLSKPTKNGYTFLGWRYHDEYITSIDTRLVKDITLDAIWSATDYSIIYHLNGGTNNVDNPSTYTIESNAISLKSPTRDYYEFKGWYTDEEFEWPISSIQNGSYGDVNVYAKWQPIVYNITYNLDGGTNSDNNPSTYTIEDNITLADANHKFRTFVGWYVCGEQVDSIQVGTTGNLVIDAKWSQTTDGWNKEHGITPVIDMDNNTVTYGLYPQTHVDSSSLTSELDKLTTPESNGWYLYNNEYYVKEASTTKKEYPSWTDNHLGFNDGTAITRGTYYWFKCEPIVWRILSVSNGSYYLLSNFVLDEYKYNQTNHIGPLTNNQQIYESNYEYSDIRAWLNGYDGSSYYSPDFSGQGFFDIAFNLDSSYIQTTTVDNSAATTPYTNDTTYVCNNTEDKVFLPSYQDYRNIEYGFSLDERSKTRACKATDYAMARGVSIGLRRFVKEFWTRTPYCSKNHVMILLDYGGTCEFDANSTRRYYVGVRPAITIKIQNNI